VGPVLKRDLILAGRKKSALVYNVQFNFVICTVIFTTQIHEMYGNEFRESSKVLKINKFCCKQL
jgi:uncharacterized membrane protein YkvI